MTQVTQNSNNYAEHNEYFSKNKYVIIPNLLDNNLVKLISKYFEYSINNPVRSTLDSIHTTEILRRRYWSSNLDTIASVSRYADPFVEALLDELKPVFEQVAGKRLHSTYSFSRVYMSGDSLKPHVDRPACEYSATISIAYKNIDSWPISMQIRDRSAGPATCSLQPGDAVLYKGCEVTHWREKLDVPNAITVQFMLHYVDADGVNSKYKYDGRPSVGSFIFPYEEN